MDGDPGTVPEEAPEESENCDARQCDQRPTLRVAPLSADDGLLGHGVPFGWVVPIRNASDYAVRGECSGRMDGVLGPAWTFASTIFACR